MVSSFALALPWNKNGSPCTFSAMLGLVNCRLVSVAEVNAGWRVMLVNHMVWLLPMSVVTWVTGPQELEPTARLRGEDHSPEAQVPEAQPPALPIQVWMEVTPAVPVGLVKVMR